MAVIEQLREKLRQGAEGLRILAPAKRETWSRAW